MRVTSHESFAECHYQKVVNIPELRHSVNTIFVLMEDGKVVHEIFLVKEVEHLPAMKLSSVDEVDGIVRCRKSVRVWLWCLSQNMPLQVVNRSLEMEILGG
jgi:hypothetical protein